MNKKECYQLCTNQAEFKRNMTSSGAIGLKNFFLHLQIHQCILVPQLSNQYLLLGQIQCMSTWKDYQSTTQLRYGFQVFFVLFKISYLFKRGVETKTELKYGLTNQTGEQQYHPTAEKLRIKKTRHRHSGNFGSTNITPRNSPSWDRKVIEIL